MVPMSRVTPLLTACLLFLTSSAFAQTPFLVLAQAPIQAAPAPAPNPTPPSLLQPQVATPFPAGVKIGFINLQTVAQESTAGKAASLQLTKLQDVKLLEIQARNQALKMLQDKQNASAVLSASVSAQIRKDIDRAQMDLQYAQQTAQKEVDDLQRDLMTAFSDKVIPVVEQVRAEKGLWAVWTIDDSLIAVLPGLDLSMEVVKRLDAQK